MHLEVCYVDRRSINAGEVCCELKSNKVGAELVIVGSTVDNYLGLCKIFCTCMVRLDTTYFAEN